MKRYTPKNSKNFLMMSNTPAPELMYAIISSIKFKIAVKSIFYSPFIFICCRVLLTEEIEKGPKDIDGSNDTGIEIPNNFLNKV